MRTLFSRWLARLLGASAAPSNREHASRRVLPTVEPLPERLVPAVLVGGDLHIYGTNAADVVTVAYHAGTISVTENGQSQSFAITSVPGRRVYFWGYDGTDTYDATNSTGVRSLAYGGNGDDTLRGGEGNDLLVGENGSDVLRGGVGNDKLLGAFDGWAGEFEGYDHLYGGDGDDELWGGDGRDLLAGENGNDLLAGQNGDDKLLGAFDGWAGEVGGNDHMYGGDGDDELWGGDGHDLLAGENGNDVLVGQNGNDLLMGAFYGWAGEVGGNDHLYGGLGDDDLWGGYGNDVLDGDAGQDYLNGEWGDDTLHGGGDDDWLDGQWGNDLIYGGAGCDLAFGGDGHDSLLGEDDHDTLHGDAGNDLVYGGGGDDMVYGGGDDDFCFGGNGRDHLYGEAGDDFLFGGYLTFSATGPSFYGELSDWNYDFLTGGAGHDTFYLGDKKAPYWWLDSGRDVTSEDEVEYAYWLGFLSPSPAIYWGHLYGTQP